MEKEFEKEIAFLNSVFPQQSDREKNPLDHSLRVGKILFETGCSHEIVIAGLFHDAIEWADVGQETIIDMYGEHVLEIILANTKDRSISDPIDRRRDYVSRCAQVGLDALLVKAADALDSYRFYSEIQDEAELDRSRQIISLVLNALPFQDHPLIDQIIEIE
jgi:(p)ppGpp synthase/HD superfamily hydrolase